MQFYKDLKAPKSEFSYMLEVLNLQCNFSVMPYGDLNQLILEDNIDPKTSNDFFIEELRILVGNVNFLINLREKQTKILV